MIVGITGGIGSGKSTACNLFRSLGVPIISADEIARHLLSHDKSVFAAIVTKFGAGILNQDYQIDRYKMHNIIFSSRADKLWLENLLHPLIKQQIAEQTKSLNYVYCIVEIPLLIEADMQANVDRILTIDCPENIQIERAMRRDTSSKEAIKAIIANQITRIARLASSHDIIDNSSDLEALKRSVSKKHEYYLSLTTDVKH